MANLLPPTGYLANTSQPHHKTFAKAHGDASLDPCHASYEAILACFDLTQNNASLKHICNVP
jgi:hypothetical protein